MTTPHASPQSVISIRRLLLVDAAVSGATGVLMSAAAPVFQTAFDLPAPLVRYAGLALLPFAALVVYFARTDRLARGQVRSVIVMNAAWVAASVLVLVSGWVAPNTFGVAFVLVQALAVAGLAELQYTALRRTGRDARVLASA
jgi:hypothetical protein